MVWRLIPPLQRVQFPWRFQILVDLALVVMLAIVIDAAPAIRARRMLIAAAPVWCLAAGVTWAVLFTPHYSDGVAQDLRATRSARADANEYRTRWTSAPFFYGVRNGDTLVSQRVDAGAVSADRNGNVHLAGPRRQPIDVVLNRFWYPSLRALAADNRGTLDTRPQAATGLAIVNVPAGVRELHMKTVLLTEEKRAWALSAATAIFILLWLWRATKVTPG